jgi:two-component system, NarL family, response regulator DesR
MIRIVIAEDQEMLLGVIGSLLNLEMDIEVVGQARNGEEAISLVNRLKPDVCIMDIEMPIMSGLEAADALRSAECKVIILTTFARTGYFARVLKAGVWGYLLKDCPSEELAGSIRSIMNGSQIFSPELIDHETSDNEKGNEVVEMLLDRLVKNETSNQPRNTIRTIRYYFSTIMEKMKLPTG